MRILFVDTFSGRCFIVIVFIVIFHQRHCSQILFEEKGQYYGAWIQQKIFIKGLGNKYHKKKMERLRIIEKEQETRKEIKEIQGRNLEDELKLKTSFL